MEGGVKLTKEEMGLLGIKPIKRIKKEWARRYGLKEAYSPRLVLKAIFGRTEQDWIIRELTSDDHMTYWNKDGKPYCIVSQPYHLHLDDLQYMVKLAERHNIRIEIRSGPSWYWPGQVLFIVYSKNSQ